MEMHQVRYFLAVVETHSFTRAAERSPHRLMARRYRPQGLAASTSTCSIEGGLASRSGLFAISAAATCPLRWA
jgi:hypothetical protein